MLACAAPLPAECADEITSLPHWVLRAQERLALAPAQQRELRSLVDVNADRLRELQARYAARRDAAGCLAQRQDMATLQLEFRDRLTAILSSEQLAEWDVLLEELIGEVHLRNAPRLVENAH